MVSLANLDNLVWRRRQEFPETTRKTNILDTVYLSFCNSFYVLLSP